MDVIVFGLGESTSLTPDQRIENDRSAISNVMKKLKLEEKINMVVRSGKPVEKATKARPLKVIFVDEQAKNELLLKARNQRKTQFNKVYIVKDLTREEKDRTKC